MDFDSFLEYLKNVKRYSVNTLKAYEEDLSQFAGFCENVELIHGWEEVTTGMVRRFVIALMTGRLQLEKEGKPFSPRPVTAKTVRRKLSALRAFFRHEMREGRVEEDPTEVVAAPKVGGRLPVFVPEYQMDGLLDERSGTEMDFGTYRDMMILMVAYCTGMRRSELVGLKLEDLDMGGRVIRITGKGDKQRIVPMIDELAEEVERYLQAREEHLQGKGHDFFFITDAGNPANEKYIYRHVRQCLGQVTSLSRRSPHVLRHSFATALLNNGACIEAIRMLLGHSSLAATQIYTHNSFESLKRVYNQAHPRA